MIDAAEALASGLVARVFPADTFMDEVMKTANTIAGYGRVAVAAAKEAVNAAQETPLGEGVRTERRLFLPLFATADQKEGMRAFAEKRAANFTHR
jgi:enoyl-CoA hydratase